MISTLENARRKRADGDTADAGFTLIELLVVVVILGILIAIAIPVYLSYKKSANDKAAQSDLRNAISTFEVCNTDSSSYPTSASLAPTTGVGTMVGCDSQKLTGSIGTSMTYYVSGTTTAYTAYTTNSGGTKTYCYSSAAGGTIKQVSSIPNAYAAAC